VESLDDRLTGGLSAVGDDGLGLTPGAEAFVSVESLVGWREELGCTFGRGGNSAQTSNITMSNIQMLHTHVHTFIL